MIYITSITQKGQATIPVEIRLFLGVKPYEKIAFVKTKNKVFLEPARNFLDLKGSIKTNKEFSDKKANQAIYKLVAKTYAQKKTNS